MAGRGRLLGTEPPRGGCWSAGSISRGGSRFFGFPLRRFQDRGLADQFAVRNEPRNVFWDCLYAVIVSSSNAVTRKSAMLQIGGYNEAVPVSPDFDLWLRLSRWFSFVSDLTVTANYRWHEKQISAVPMRQRRSVYESR